MNIDVELEQISKAANVLDDFADSMQKLAIRLGTVASNIYGCYERGGTGYRAGNALKAMKSEINDLKDRAVVLNRAVAIYKGEDEKQTSKGKQTVSTIENGYDVNWTKRPAVSKIISSVASTAVSGSIAVSTAIAIGGWLKDATSSGIEIIPVTPAEDRPAVAPVNNEIDENLEKEAQEIADSLIDYTNKKLKIKTTKPSETAVEVGTIRFISQVGSIDTKAWGIKNASVGCIAAAKSMALSSLGIDHLPNKMNLGSTGYVNNDNVKQYNLKQIVASEKESQEKRINTLDECLKNYLSNPQKYAPPVVRVKTYSGNHSMLIVGRDEKGYIVVDSGGFGGYVGGKWTTWTHYSPQTIGYKPKNTDPKFMSELIGVFQYYKK